MAVVIQALVFHSYAIQDNTFIPKFPPELYLVTLKTEAATPCETLEETYYPLRRKIPEGCHWRLATLGNGLVAIQVLAIATFHYTTVFWTFLRHVQSAVRFAARIT